MSAVLLDALVRAARDYGNSELLRVSLAEVLAEHAAQSAQQIAALRATIAELESMLAAVGAGGMP